MIIRAEAEGTDTYELNRNLVLTDGTRVDSVPDLEILTGEVAGAGHASASGRLDDQHLFYLQARGIPYDIARRMVVRGFLGQLVEKIGHRGAAGARAGGDRRGARAMSFVRACALSEIPKEGALGVEIDDTPADYLPFPTGTGF